MRRPSNLGYQLGVTMIELMITIAIIAILVAVALPSFSGTIERQRLRFAVETIVSDLRLAQTNAIAQGARGSSVVEFTVNGGDASITLLLIPIITIAQVCGRHRVVTTRLSLHSL